MNNREMDNREMNNREMSNRGMNNSTMDIMKNKGLLAFIIALNVVCWAYGCLSIMWSYWSIWVLLGSVVNVVSMIYCMTALAKHSKRGRIYVCVAAIMFAVYAAIYLAFDRAFTPVSFVIAGSSYGVVGAVMKLIDVDIASNMQLVMGIGFVLCALIGIYALIKKEKRSS